jgi:hypothetical protein
MFQQYISPKVSHDVNPAADICKNSNESLGSTKDRKF